MMLRTFALRLDHNPRGYMGQPHGTVRLVDVLPARPARPKRVHFDIPLVQGLLFRLEEQDEDGYRCVSIKRHRSPKRGKYLGRFWQNHGYGSAGMHAAFRFCCRHALHAMDTVFIAQGPVCALTSEHANGLLLEGKSVSDATIR